MIFQNQMLQSPTHQSWKLKRTKLKQESLTNWLLSTFKAWALYFYIFQENKHCVESAQRKSFFWSVFSCIQREYRKIRTRKKLRTWTLSTQWKHLKNHKKWFLFYQKTSFCYPDIQIFVLCSPLFSPFSAIFFFFSYFI